MIIELIGFIATFLVFISFIPKDIKLIRWLNLIGSIFFVVYGFYVEAFWTGILNICLVFVQIYHLFLIYWGKKIKKN